MVETRKRPTNRLEKLKMKIKPMTLQKKQQLRKTTKMFTARFVTGTHKCSMYAQFVYAICGSYSEDSESCGLKITCNLCVRKNRIKIEREGAKSGQEQQAKKNGFSLQLKTSSS